MSDWSWKQAVAECVLDLVNRSSSTSFTTDQVYKYAPRLSELFPRNRHVNDKIRQILQQLRDDRFITFESRGNYVLNLDYEDLEKEAAFRSHQGVESPTTRRVWRNVRLRCTFLSTELKRRYASLCQVCRTPVVLSPEKNYAEAHHLRPLGAPHFGPDVPGNIVVLCPNHHVMFDRGAATIVPGSLVVRHAVKGVIPRRTRLFVEPWHELDPKYIEYHHHKVFETVL